MTLAARVASLIERGVRPERILLLTFSRRAAREMVSRARRLTANDDAGRLGRHVPCDRQPAPAAPRPRWGLTPDFTVLDQADGADVMNLLATSWVLLPNAFPRKDTLAAIYSRTVNAGERLTDVLRRHYPWCVDEAEGICEIFRGYTERKRRQRVLDYDDLLFWKALRRRPAELRARSTTSSSTSTRTRTRSRPTSSRGCGRPDGPRNLTVGDDAQAIYGFRAATVKNILEFPSGSRLGDREARTELPVDAADPGGVERGDRAEPAAAREDAVVEPRGRGAAGAPRLSDEAEQSDAVCRAVLAHREEGVALKAQAVLFRAAHHLDHLEVELARNIPFVKYGAEVHGGGAREGRARVPADPGEPVRGELVPVLQLPDQMGPASARRLMDELAASGDAADAASPLARFLVEPVAVPRGRRRRPRSAPPWATASTPTRPPAAQLARLRTFLGR